MANIQNANKCTILVNSCDSYEDLWLPFFELFKKFWSDCPYDIVLNTESKKYVDDDLNIKTLNYEDKTNKDYYGKRIKKCLKRIKSPYVIILLDDFFLREAVNEEFIEKILGYMDDNPDVECFNFDIPHDKYDIEDGRFLEFRKRSRFGEYKYNMQAGIWRTDSLYRSWRNMESPWQWELYGNTRAWRKNSSIYLLKPEFQTPLEYGYEPKPRGVYRGKWVVDDVKELFEQNNIFVDYSKRGIYTEADETDSTEHVIKKKIYSYGVWGYIKYFLWYIQNRKSIMKEQLTYSESLNTKEYGKK